MVWSGHASAITFTLSSSALSAHTSEDGGLKLDARPHIGFPYTFNLRAVGEEIFIPGLFVISIDEACCRGVSDGDRDVSPLTASFNFSAPSTASGGPVRGTSQGYGMLVFPDHTNGALIKWQGSAIYSFIDGTALAVALGNADITCNTDCSDHPARLISGTFTLLARPVPLPATLPLFAAGVGVIGGAAWRRKRKKV